MNNSIKMECPEATMWELMAEIERLKQENMELRIDNELLHNRRCTEKDLEELEESYQNNNAEEEETPIIISSALVDIYAGYGYDSSDCN